MERKLKASKKSLETKKATILELKKTIDNFHADYLIKTCGGMVESLDVQIDSRLSKIAALQQDIAEIEKCIETLDAEEGAATTKQNTDD